MAKLFFTDIDLKGNQLVSPVLHKLSKAPSNPKEGQLYYDDTDKLTWQCIGYNNNEPIWIPVTGSVVDKTTDKSKVVTGVGSSEGKATLETTDVKSLQFAAALPHIGSTSLQTLQEVFEAVDETVEKRVKIGSIANVEGLILVTEGTNGDKAKTTGFSIQSTSLNAGSNDEVPTSKAIADYVGSLAGGLDYKGELDWNDPNKQHTLPTTGVKNGDVWVVGRDTDATHHYTSDEEAFVGDLYVASVARTTVTWDRIPLNFTVNNRGIQKLAPQDGTATIATVDGKDITLGLQNITVNPTATGEANGNVVDGISFDGNNVATLNKKKVIQEVYQKEGNTDGVVINVEKDPDGIGLQITRKNLTLTEPENIQYVAKIQQSKDGKISVTAGQFDQSVDPTTGEHVAIAPSTKAVKDYVDGEINNLDVNGINIVTKENDLVYLQQVVKETDGKINLDGGETIYLQKVASTGQAADVKVPANSGLAGSETNVLNSLQGLQNALQSLDADVVKSIGGKIGVVELGNGLEAGSENVNDIHAKVKANDYVKVDDDGIQLDSTKIDNAYDEANNTKLATVQSIQKAIGGLDVNDISGFGKGKTLQSLTQTDGKISAQFENIEITSSQISDKQDIYIGTDDKVITGKGVKDALGTLDKSEEAVADGDSGKAIKIYGIYEVDGVVALQQTGDTVRVWNLQGTYNATNNQIALQSTVKDAIDELDGSHNVVTISDHQTGSNEHATKKIEFFDATEINGKISTNSPASDTLYITKGVTASNPLITWDDLGDITGAMVYRDSVKYENNAWIFGGGSYAKTLKTGDVFVVSGNFTLESATALLGKDIPAGTYEAGDMFVYNGSVWNIISGENQVESKGINILAGIGLQTIAVVDGTNIEVGVKITAGTAQIASQSGKVVTIKSGIQQVTDKGTVENNGGTDITLAEVASTGKAEDVKVNNGKYGDYNVSDDGGNVQLALQGLQSVLTTVDGKHGDIKTGNGLTDVADNNRTFGINLDGNESNGLYLKGDTEGSKTLALKKSTGTQLGALQAVTGNGLYNNDGVLQFTHNTQGITVATESDNVVTINGTLTPDASDTITPSNPITLEEVAVTGAAADVSIADSGDLITANNVEAALQELATNIGNSICARTLNNPALTVSSGVATWNITVNSRTEDDWQNHTIVELRDKNENVVEAGISYDATGKKIVVTFNSDSNIAANEFKVVIHTKNKYTISN